MDLLAALKLQIEWGADEALLEAPVDRRKAEPRRAEVSPAAFAAARPVVRANIAIGPAEAARIAAACGTLAELRAALEAFGGCALRDTATQLVFADGPDDARTMVVGDAPGADEDRAGRPFLGAEGQLLDKMLASIGLSRVETRLANTVPWRPPGNRPPTENELALCLPFLRRHIALLRPRCLLVLGGVAAKAFWPDAVGGLRRLRGQWREVALEGLPAPIPALPSYHPGYLLRTPAAKKAAWHDLLALRAHLEQHYK